MTKQELLIIKEKCVKNLEMATKNNNVARMASFQDQLNRVNEALKEVEEVETVEFVQNPKDIKKYCLDERKSVTTKQGSIVRLGQVITPKRGNKKYIIIGFNGNYAMCRSLEGNTIKDYAYYNMESYVHL